MIKKAVIEITEDRGRFLPLSNQVPKELFMLSDMPVLNYLVDEATSLGVKEIVFWNKKTEKRFKSLFDNLDSQEDELRKKGNKRAEKIKELKERIENIQFSFGKDLFSCLNNSDNFAFISSDILINNKKNSLEQLMEIFKTSERPVVGLLESDIGEIETEKIAKGIYKVKGFGDKSNFSLVGRGIFTSESVKFFENQKNLSGVIEKMIERGHTVYGIVLSGEKFYLNNLESFLKANFYYTLKSEHSSFIKDYLKKTDLL